MADPKESWLRFDDPDKWAAAMGICRHPAGHCGHDGYCHYGDCFKRHVTESDWLEIELAASGYIDGTSDAWPALRAAIEKITGKPFGPRKCAAWLQGFCEGTLAQRRTKP